MTVLHVRPKRLPVIRNEALSFVSHIAINSDFRQDEWKTALFQAARSLGLVKRQ